ncbi:MAG: FliH/SctL family protein [Syntrophobacteraceae bacterium]|nr:FliH/SctL family protein [Syntrophobacteraceae bacterium]
MSSLLKKSAVAAFGFPVIPKAPDIPKEPEEAEPGSPPEEQPPEPEITAEELYRRKLLEIERRTQEIERDAYSKGFSQGEKDGLDYGKKSVQVVSSQLERLAKHMEDLPAKVLEDYRDWLIRTSMGIARQIVTRELRTDPDIVAELARELIDEAEQHSTLTVYLNPHDLETIEKKAGLAPEGDRKNFVLKADREIERGGCRIESAIQLLETSVAGMFENLEKQLRQNGEKP